jgi:hypothetical protein
MLLTKAQNALYCGMKIENNKIGAITEGFGENDITVVGVNKDALEFVSQMFQNDIYSNKLLAAIRETIANAIDEHKKFNIEEPVLVEYIYRPEQQQDYLVIRDFAKGLDEKNLREVFGGLFCSTKNLTNDSTGGFGVGAKSPICYNENFLVNSFFENKKLSFMFFRDKGKTGSSITKIAKFNTEETNEPSGIELKIPILSGDRNRCIDITRCFVQAQSLDTKIVFKYKNESYTPLLEDQWDLGLVKICQKKEGALYAHGIRMGAIVYPIPSSFSAPTGVEYKQDTLFEVPIGTFSMPPSRETLSDTPENIKKWNLIKNKIQEFHKDCLQKFEVKFENLAECQLKSECFRFAPHTFGIPYCSSTTYSDKINKRMVVAVEGNRSKRLWIDRINSFNKENPETRIVVAFFNREKTPKVKDFLSTFDKVKDIDECIFVKNDKRFKPDEKAKHADKEFVFKKKESSYGSFRFEKMTIEDFCFNNPLPDEVPDLKSIKSIKELKEISIASFDQLNHHSGAGEPGVWYVCNSAVKILEEMGYLRWREADTKDVIEQLFQKEREFVEKQTTLCTMCNFSLLSKKTREILYKHNRSNQEKGFFHVQRIQKAIEKIADKSPLHRKLLDKTSNLCYNGLNRKEIKHIINNI